MTHRQFPWLPESVEREGVLRIDFTGYSNIEACKRKAGLALAWKRELAAEQPELFFGRAIHTALDVRQKAIMAGETCGGLLAKMEAALEAHYQGVVLPEGEYRTLGRAKEVVGVYQQTWAEEPFKILASERSREKRLGAVLLRGLAGRAEQFIEVFWQGLTDGIWQNPDTGERCIKDTKTSSRNEFADADEGEFSKGEAKYQTSVQFQMYCWALSGPLGPVTGAVLDQIVVRKPVQRVTAKTPPQNECFRRFFTYTPEQIEETRRDVLRNIEEWLNASLQGPPPMTRSNCAWPKVCPYFSSCVQPSEELRMLKLAGPRFKDRTWDPMKG